MSNEPRENDGYVWRPLPPNEHGLSHVLHDKQRVEWWIVRDTTHRAPAKCAADVGRVEEHGVEVAV